MEVSMNENAFAELTRRVEALEGDASRQLRAGFTETIDVPLMDLASDIASAVADLAKNRHPGTKWR
jgi:hypothetical protein